MLTIWAKEILGNGLASSVGSAGGSNTSAYGAGAGGSGGGTINIFTLTPNNSLLWTTNVAGGTRGSGTDGANGGAGGSGSTTFGYIQNGTFFKK